MIGSRVGSYEILSLLGRGGMGEVYRARDTVLGRDVAVKLLPSDVAADPDRMSRFSREARLLAALNHPHIATIHGFEQASGICALVMELVEGPTLTDYTEGFGQFSPDGRWIAYQSDRTGRFEVYLRRFPGGNDTRISTDGGSQPRWNPKGNELFYVADDDRLMAVPMILPKDAKASPEHGTATPLFTTNIGSAVSLLYRHQYVVARDGESFVMNSVAVASSASPITVI